MQELIVIFVVALLVFGPKKLPELARSMGKGIGQLKKAMTDIKSEVDSEISDATEQVKHEVPSWKDVVDVDKIKEDLTVSTDESKSDEGDEIYREPGDAAQAQEQKKEDHEPVEEEDPGEGSGREREADG
jgi:TatA/E family protein of Tat protein translocase